MTVRQRGIIISIAIIVVIVVVALVAKQCQAADLGIVTGSEQGTYYAFGQNLQQTVKSGGINLTVYPSRGSVENLWAVYQRPGVQLGIVQADVLTFVAKVQTDPILKRIAQKIKLVYPLYNEEVQILGREGILEFDELAGKRVAVGREGSGTYLTARLLFQIADVQAQMIYVDTADALADLKAGKLDAMVYVAGAPTKLYAEGVTPSDKLALVQILNKNIAEIYPAVDLPAGTYPWQPKPVRTVAVKAALVTFDYKASDCENVGKFAQLVAAGFDGLQRTGHPKWRTVSLDAPLRGWEQYDCVKKYLAKAPPKRSDPRALDINPILGAIKAVLGD